MKSWIFYQLWRAAWRVCEPLSRALWRVKLPFRLGRYVWRIARKIELIPWFFWRRA